MGGDVQAAMFDSEGYRAEPPRPAGQAVRAAAPHHPATHRARPRPAPATPRRRAASAPRGRTRRRQDRGRAPLRQLLVPAGHQHRLGPRLAQVPLRRRERHRYVSARPAAPCHPRAGQRRAPLVAGLHRSLVRRPAPVRRRRPLRTRGVNLMDLSTLISPEEATDRLRHYEAQIATERTPEDDAIRAGYRAAARGLPVISLPDAIHAGGYFDDTGLPRIAITRADAETCWLRSTTRDEGRHRLEYSDVRDARGWADVGRHRVVVHTPGPGPGYRRTPWISRTLVPSIPPQHRPRRSRLARFHVLWEVEQWTLVAPVDPALLRHIRGDLWAVVATWDLTPLERAVLTARAGGGR